VLRRNGAGERRPRMATARSVTSVNLLTVDRNGFYALSPTFRLSVACSSSSSTRGSAGRWRGEPRAEQGGLGGSRILQINVRDDIELALRGALPQQSSGARRHPPSPRGNRIVTSAPGSKAKPASDSTAIVTFLTWEERPEPFVEIGEELPLPRSHVAETRPASNPWGIRATSAFRPRSRAAFEAH